jgi:hypothetical protein
MFLLALVFAVFFLPSYTLFNVGGSVPSTGLGDVLQAPMPAATGSPKLAIKAVHPFVIVAGTGFKRGEVVKLTGVGTKRVRASARGTFTTRLRNSNPCGGISLTAVGSKGSRTALNVSELLCVDR